MRQARHVMQSFWDHEEFEDHLIRGVLACYESLSHREMKNIDPAFRMTKQEVLNLQSVGPYFPPFDRIAMSNRVDLQNDTLIKTCSFGAVGPDADPILSRTLNDHISGYCNIAVAIMVGHLPSSHLIPYACLQEPSIAAYYKIMLLLPFQNKGYLALKDYLAIGATGQVYPCPAIKQNWSHGLSLPSIIQTDKETATRGAVTINMYNDKRFLWNVVATEGRVKVTFGVYEEQVKSLFYARELPVTVTRRKSPILHWVAAHRRRMKSGVEVNIGQHLRGTSSFEMLGAKFEIINPSRPYKPRSTHAA